MNCDGTGVAVATSAAVLLLTLPTTRLTLGPAPVPNGLPELAEPVGYGAVVTPSAVELEYGMATTVAVDLTTLMVT